MKSGTIMKVVGGIAAVVAAALGTIMLIGKKKRRKYEEETVMVEPSLEENTEAAAGVDECGQAAQLR